MSLNSAVTDTQWSPNYSAGRPAPPDHIVMHHWGADGQNHQDVVNYLCRIGGNSSAHYVASAGRVTQLVHDYDRAWHAGSSGNPRGIGIECRPEATREDFETVAHLIAAIREQWGDLPLVGHRDHMPTACPGRWYPMLAELSQRANNILEGKEDDMSIHDIITRPDGHTATLGDMIAYTDMRLERLEHLLTGGGITTANAEGVSEYATDIVTEMAWNPANTKRITDRVDAVDAKVKNLEEKIDQLLLTLTAGGTK